MQRFDWILAFRGVEGRYALAGPNSSAYTGAMLLLPRGVADARRRAASWSIHAAVVALMILLGLSFVPSDMAYSQVERALSMAEPVGSASQHLRTIPSTASSIILEAFQSRALEVEGVEVNLDYAVNPTERVEERRFYSEVLGEDRTYRVYLPPGYEAEERAMERYPAVYLLHGMSQGHQWWTEVARVDRIATAMIEAGKIRPSIIVMPNGNRVERDVSTTSLYDDHCTTGMDVVARALKAVGDRLQRLRIYKISCDGDFEEFIAREVVYEIDSRYRTSGERYVGGFSMGARGALQLAFANPDVYTGAFGLSPNPPKDTDGRREDSGRGWVRELQGRWPGVGVDGRSADGLQSPHRAPKALCGSCDARDGERIRSRGLSRTGVARDCGDVESVAGRGRQAGSGMARSRARARLNCSSQGQRRGRCRVNRRAERVIRPAKAKTRRLRVLVVTVC